MKKYIAILCLLFLVGCENDFYKEVNKYLTIENQKDKIDLVNGIYSRLVRVHNRNYFHALERSDDINCYYSYSFFRGDTPWCSSSGGSSDYTGISGEIYVNLYEGIININYLLKNLKENEDGKLIGELYFLRAYFYFKLARLFGTPPLVADVDVNYSLDKPSFAEVYLFIENDLLKAIELLPENNTDARIPNETPHKGTAKALLAEIYLTMGGYPLYDTNKYSEAARLAGEVIEKADYYNFALLPDYATLWKENSRHNSEYIFGLFFSDKSTETFNEIGSYSIFNIGPANDVELRSAYTPDMKFYTTYPENYRKEITFVTGRYNNIAFFGEDTLFGILHYDRYDPITDPCNYIGGVVVKKWIDITEEKYNKDSAKNRWGSSYLVESDVTIYLLRYAQTLLTYAEAKARSGNLDDSAFEMVNRVRRRANHVDLNTPSPFDLPPSLSAEQFIDSVVSERGWELCGEPDGRWFDIVRLDKKDELLKNRLKKDFPNTIPASNLTDDWYFFKIPEEDRWLNPNFQ